VALRVVPAVRIEGALVTFVCTACEEEVKDPANWDEEDQLCIPCFEVSGGPKYCCGAIYEDGEDTCMSCGEPL
jgi:hypothetical protein